MKMHVLAFGVVVGLLGSGMVWGDLVDQSQLLHDYTSPIGNLTSGNYIGQTFMPGIGINNISGVGVFLDFSGASITSGNVSLTARLCEYDFNSGAHTIGSTLRSVTETFDLNSYSIKQGWFTFEFDSPWMTTPNEDYYFDILSSTGNTYPTLNVLGSERSPRFGAGTAYSYDLNAARLGFAFGNGIVNSDLDLAFKTYAVPTPGAVVLGILGLGSAGTYLRRRRRV